ncbi:MAG: hypothetical protein ACRC10_08435 [Thermoguttaceae bacterium]
MKNNTNSNLASQKKKVKPVDLRDAVIFPFLPSSFLLPPNFYILSQIL